MQLINESAPGEWVCLCGNTGLSAGFFPCDQAGNEVEPTEEAWTTDCYVCDQCGRIIRQADRRVVGIRSNNTLTEAEKQAIFQDDPDFGSDPTRDMSPKVPFLGGIYVWPRTKSLVEKLFLDRPLGVPDIADFGVETPNHYRALRAVLDSPVLDGLTDEESVAKCAEIVSELDQAYGNGPALTALVEKYAPEWKGKITFTTSWDGLAEIWGEPEVPPER
jgi:hypothetical protein